ncbi:MAG: hypothetical protein N2645_14890 [Clostridia bacterium]|nr:hypothetical protein [Clostridia bacterium]
MNHLQSSKLLAFILSLAGVAITVVSIILTQSHFIIGATTLFFGILLAVLGINLLIRRLKSK